MSGPARHWRMREGSSAEAEAMEAVSDMRGEMAGAIVKLSAGRRAETWRRSGAEQCSPADAEGAGVGMGGVSVMAALGW